MGKKANLVTLRKEVESKVNLANSSNREFVYGTSFVKALTQILKKKYIKTDKVALNFLGNQAHLGLSVFYQTKRVALYKKNFYLKFRNKTKRLKKRQLKLLIKKNCKKRTKKSKLIGNHKIMKYLKALKCNQIIFSIKNLNLKLNFKKVARLYKSLRVFEKQIFQRRKQLFTDLLKVSSLFHENKVTTKSFLDILGESFSLILKKNHGRYFRFVTDLLTTLIRIKASSNDKELVGMKFLISGKLKGKLRAKSYLIERGSVPIQTLSKNIDFNKKTVYTRYGTFGIKLWSCRN